MIFTLYTTLPHHLINDNFMGLINRIFTQENIWLATKNLFLSILMYSSKHYKLWSCQNVCDVLVYHLNNIFIRSGTKLYRQTIDIPMETYCAPLVTDLFSFFFFFFFFLFFFFFVMKDIT